MEKVIFEKRDGIGWLWINRPDVRNAIDKETAIRMREIILSFHKDRDVRLLAISGKGDNFSSGAELKKEDGVDGVSGSHEVRIRSIYQGIILAIRDCPKPVVALVKGYAVGFGCDIALTCDLRLASRDAKFSEIFVSLSLVPDGGGSYNLPKIVGLGRALELMFTGRFVSADEALSMGLVNAVYDDEAFYSSTEKFLKEIAEKSLFALERIKRAVYSSIHENFIESLVREAKFQEECILNEDFKIKLREFFEKKKGGKGA